MVFILTFFSYVPPSIPTSVDSFYVRRYNRRCKKETVKVFRENQEMFRVSVPITEVEMGVENNREQRSYFVC